jgi:RNA polymerase subunit RPABC4/transcription elongation factor Spt4
MKQAIAGFGIVLLAIAIVLIVLPFVPISRTASQSYKIPQSTVMVSESFVVPPGTVTHTLNLNAGDSVIIDVTVTSGGNKDIDFSVNDGTTTYLSYSRATTVNRDWTAPVTATYNFVYDNSFSLITSKGITVQVTKNWSQTAYKDVTVNSAILPFGYVYGGIALVLLGLIFATSAFALSPIGAIITLYEKQKVKKIRACPQCNQKVSIDKQVCPYCGFDITKSVRCKHCNALYSSSSYICPHCGAKRE